VSGNLYAVKSILKSRIRRFGEQRTFELLERERKTLKLLAASRACTGLVRLICSGHDDDWLRMVLPAYLGGDLSGLLEAHGKAMKEETVQFYAGCLVLGLQQLHGLGIAFRDLKPENVLLSADGWPVLTDFGLVSFVTHADDWCYSMVGTPEFMAPEVLDGSGHTTDCDYWSLGVTLCELLTLHTPFRENAETGHHQATYANILSGRYAKSFEREHARKMESRTASLISGLLTVDTAVRLGGYRRGIESLRVHPFFWGLSWEALENHTLTPPDSALCETQSLPRKFVEASGGVALPDAIPTISSKPKKKTPVELDAAAKALDRMFDFSDWGEER